MPGEKDSFRRYVAFLRNGRWKCQFCNNEHGGSVTRIKAHLAGVGGKGIDACKDVSDQVKLEAKKALMAKGAAGSSNGEEGTIEEGQHMSLTANNEDTWRWTLFASTPCLNADAISTSVFLPLPDTHLPNQFLPGPVMIPEKDLPSWPQPRQNVIPMNAEGGEPNIEVPPD